MARAAALPARFPPTGVWPAEMRADMAAAYFDFRDTAELQRAIARGEAPPPSALRGLGRSREPIWHRHCLDQHIAPATPTRQDDARPRENLAALL
jgi:hypothetical protein